MRYEQRRQVEVCPFAAQATEFSASAWYHSIGIERASVGAGPLILSLHIALYQEEPATFVSGRPSMHTTPTVEHTNTRGSQRPLIAYCLERATMLFSIKMALVVGTLLAVINHGQAIVTGHFTSDRLFPMLLTYCVPFTVAMYSQIQGKLQRDRLQAEVSATAMQTVMKPTDEERSDRM